MYLRIAALYRISRFPYISSHTTSSTDPKWIAWAAQKEVYMKAASVWTCPITEVMIPFTAKLDEKEQAYIPTYIRLPASASTTAPCPTVILMTGLDGYRPDNTGRLDMFLERGWGAVVVEIPGTADCPADPSDVTSPDRMWDSLLTWMRAEGVFDMRKLVVWGLSAGGYYAIRAAHTHAEQLRGVVAQGAGAHHFFGAEWLDRIDGHEYPFRYVWDEDDEMGDRGWGCYWLMCVDNLGSRLRWR